MSTFGKTIRLFLVDGTTNGLTTAELSNWTGMGVKVPRIKIAKIPQARTAKGVRLRRALSFIKIPCL